MSARAAQAAAPTWPDVLRALPPGGADVLRWLAGSDDVEALAAWRRWVEQAMSLPAPLLICPASRR